MCGINGLYGLKEEFRTRDLLVHMNAALVHRGPDAQGVFTRGMVGLGHRRLSIIDLSDDGRQPMLNRAGNVSIVFNGEIYNYKKLQAECKNYEFQTATDTEVILALYEKYGEKCFELLDGMFAIAIWDDTKKRLILARDRMGKKPLYYAWKDGVFIFSSEIRGILATKLFHPQINKEGLAQYLQFQTVYSPNTILKDVFMLEAATCMTIEAGITDKKRFWNLDRAKEKYSLTGPYDKVVKQTRDLFFKAVEKRLISDVPLGAFLSGGIDSSSVVAAMSEVGQGKVKTFNVYFDDEQFSESKYAEIVAKKFKTEHHAIHLTAGDFLENLEEALCAMDHPGADGQNTYIVSKFTKQAGITVALSGLGGDEIFCGYPVFQYMKMLKRYRLVGGLPVGMRKLLLKIVRKRLSDSQAKRMMQIAELKQWEWTEIYPVFRMILTDAEIHAMGLIPLNFHDIEGDSNSGFRLMSEVSIAECKTYLENILLRDADQMSMASSLEVRVPFLDKDLMEFVLSLPDDFKPIKPGKKLLIDAMGDLLPKEVWDRPKMGFTFPWKRWINNELRNFCKENLEFLLTGNLIAKGYLNSLLISLDAEENKEWFKVWNVVVLAHWIKKNNINFD